MDAFRFAVSLGVAGFAWTGSAPAEPPDPAPRGPMEKLALFSPEAAKEWAGVESTTGVSTERVKDAAQSLRWHVTVDHHAGEKLYPVGWPRFGRTFPAGPQRDWSGWDYLHGWLHTESSRAALPREVAGLSVRFAGGEAGYERPLSELKKGEWTELLIPVSRLEHAEAVERLQFHLSESHYDHGDTLDLHVSDLALLRHAAPTLLSFAPESAVVYADAARLAVWVHLAGVKPGEECDLVCELRRGAVAVARLSARARRGAQRLSLGLEGTRPAPGEYDLVATLEGNPTAATAKLRIVESPWR